MFSEKFFALIREFSLNDFPFSTGLINLNLLGVKNSPKIKDIPKILKNHLIRINPVRLFKAFKFSIKQAILNKHLC